MRVQLAIVSALLILISNPTLGLGLGQLEGNTLLNQPFEAKIRLLDVQAEDFDNLTVGLANRAEFNRAGVEYPILLSDLRFELVQPTQGADYIRIYSREPITEPFLTFLVEVNWREGRLLREYTSLIDPPRYQPAPQPPPASTRIPPRAAQSTLAATYDAPRAAPPRRAATPSSARSRVKGNDFGPTRSGDTLWSIASGTRPNSGVSVEQMMLALLRANPQAFIDDNINLLRKGQVLRIPDSQAIDALSRSQALSEVAQHHVLWNEYRRQQADGVTRRPTGAASSQGATVKVPGETPSTDAPAPAEDARLELLSAATDKQADRATGEKLGVDEDNLSGDQSNLVEEGLAASEGENHELRGRLDNAEELVELLQRQVELKDTELAAMQAKLAESRLDTAENGAQPSEDVAPEDATLEDEALEEEDAILAVEDEAAEIADAPGVEELVEDTDEATLEDAEQAVESVDVLAVDEEEGASDTLALDEPATEPATEVASSQEAPEEGSGASWFEGKQNIILGALAILLLGALWGFMRLRDKGEKEKEFFEEPQFAANNLDSAETPIAVALADEPTDEEEQPTYAEIPDEVEDFAELPGDQALSEKTVDVSSFEETQQLIDPLEEVNVYLAYERFEQAEELVKHAIKGAPGVHEYKLRLLEVYYAANDKAAYEETARELHAVTGEGPLWNSTLAMWKEMSPDEPLSLAATSPRDDEVEDASSQEVLDITTKGDLAATQGQDVQNDAMTLDFDIAQSLADTGELRATVELPKSLEIGTDAPDSKLDEVLDFSAESELDSELDQIEKEISQLSMGDMEHADVLDFSVTEGRGLHDSVIDITETIDAEPEVDIFDQTVVEKPAIARTILDVTEATSPRDEDAIVDLTDEKSGIDLPEMVDHVETTIVEPVEETVATAIEEVDEFPDQILNLTDDEPVGGMETAETTILDLDDGSDRPTFSHTTEGTETLDVTDVEPSSSPERPLDLTDLAGHDGVAELDILEPESPVAETDIVQTGDNEDTHTISLGDTESHLAGGGKQHKDQARLKKNDEKSARDVDGTIDLAVHLTEQTMEPTIELINETRELDEFVPGDSGVDEDGPEYDPTLNLLDAQIEAAAQDEIPRDGEFETTLQLSDLALENTLDRFEQSVRMGTISVTTLDGEQASSGGPLESTETEFEPTPEQPKVKPSLEPTEDLHNLFDVTEKLDKTLHDVGQNRVGGRIDEALVRSRMLMEETLDLDQATSSTEKTSSPQATADSEDVAPMRNDRGNITKNEASSGVSPVPFEAPESGLVPDLDLSGERLITDLDLVRPDAQDPNKEIEVEARSRPSRRSIRR